MDVDCRPEDIIRYGNQVSLKHNQTGRYLTSVSGFNYEGGSGQQVAFAGAWEPTDDSTFIVLPGGDNEAEEGNDVNFGEIVRLKHVVTRAHLHSHPDIASPVTEQQEVTCYGDDEFSDENDLWVFEQWSFDEEENNEFDPEDRTLYVGRSFILRHLTTNLTLHSHEESLSEDMNEITCYGSGPDDNDRWRIVF